MRTAASVVPLLLLTLAAAAWQQELPPQPKPDGKVCIATVGNASTNSAFVEHLTERLSHSLSRDKVKNVSMDSRTTTDRELRPTEANGRESRDNDCDYILLTQIAQAPEHAIDPYKRDVVISRPTPDIDASNPAPNRRAPFARDVVQIRFAIFRIGRLKPVVDTSIRAYAAQNVSDSFLPVMDRIASRVAHEVRK